MPKMAMAEQITEIMTTFTKPSGSSWNGKCTFVPHKLNMIVGTAIVMVRVANIFITMLRLLEMIDVKAFIMFIKILEYISTISMA